MGMDRLQINKIGMKENSIEPQRNSVDSNTSNPIIDSLITEVVEKNLGKLEECLQGTIEMVLGEKGREAPSVTRSQISPQEVGAEGESGRVEELLSEFQTQLGECKAKILREMQVEIDNEREKYMVVLNDYELKSSQLIDMQTHIYKLQSEILQMRHDTMSTGSKKESEEGGLLKRNNERLIQQNKEQMEKLYVALAENAELKGEVSDAVSKIQRLEREFERKEEVYLEQLKAQGRGMGEYEEVEQDEFGNSKIREKGEGEGLTKEIELLRREKIVREEEYQSLKQLVEEREDDNRYLRNQLLIKQQEIFKLKTQKSAAEDPLRMLVSKDSLKYSQDESEIVKNLEDRPYRISAESVVSNTNEVIIQSRFQRQMRSQLSKNNTQSHLQKEEFRETTDFPPKELRPHQLRIHDISKQGVSQILGSQIQPIGSPPLAPTLQDQNARVDLLLRQNERLKQELGRVHDSLEDSKREEQLANVKSERDGLLKQLGELRRGQEQYVIRINEMEAEMGASEERTNAALRRGEENQGLVERLREQNLALSFNMSKNRQRETIQHSTFQVLEEEDEWNRHLAKIRGEKEKLNKELLVIKMELLELKEEYQGAEQRNRELKRENSAKDREVKRLELRLMEAEGVEEECRERIESLEREKSREVGKLVALANRYKEVIREKGEEAERVSVENEERIRRMECEVLSSKITNNPYYHKCKENDVVISQLKDQISSLEETVNNMKERESVGVPATKLTFECGTQTEQICVENERVRESDEQSPLEREIEIEEGIEDESESKRVIQELNLEIHQLRAENSLLNQQILLLTQKDHDSPQPQTKQIPHPQETPSPQSNPYVEKIKSQAQSDASQPQPKPSNPTPISQQKLLHAQIHFLNLTIIQKDKEIMRLQNTHPTPYHSPKQPPAQLKYRLKKYYSIHPTNSLAV